jgi:chlorobactene glucosyltransferase
MIAMVLKADTIYVLLSTLGMIIGLWIAFWVHSRHQIKVIAHPVRYPPDWLSPIESISIIVPARNESRNIHRCIQGLLDQNFPDFEVIAVDDRSSDDTLQVLQEFSARPGISLHVIQGEELPPGWAGKPYALHQGVESAQGDWLCFVDADTFARPEMLLSAYTTARTLDADLFTMLTDQVLGSFWEKVVLPLVFTGLSFGFPPTRVNDPSKTDAIANGQFILIKTSVYRAAGGHQAVRERIDEDKALAEMVKKAGYHLVIADGRQLAQTRMYTTFVEMWEGWTKNIYVGLSDRPWLLMFGILVSMLGGLVLQFWLIGSWIWIIAGGGYPAVIVTIEVGILYIFLLLIRARAAVAFKISPFYAFTLPLGALIFTGMMLASTYKVLFGQGVTWKGRRYQKID